jgi:ribose 5-phosphate isomerase B
MKKSQLRIAIGADHRGLDHKKNMILKEIVETTFIRWFDVGTYSDERTDYPVIVNKLVDIMRGEKISHGIMLCGSGVGASIAANRYHGIYAGLCWNAHVARLAKEDDNINVLVLPADFIQQDFEIDEIIHAWLTSEFKGGRYQKRLDMIDNIRSA